MAEAVAQWIHPTTNYGACPLASAGAGTIAGPKAFSQAPSSKSKRENAMKTLISMLALALALGFSGPAFAQDDVTKATDKASCDKAGGVWDDTAKKCSKKM
jgi:hypothetical protein